MLNGRFLVGKVFLLDGRGIQSWLLNCIVVLRDRYLAGERGLFVLLLLVVDVTK